MKEVNDVYISQLLAKKKKNLMKLGEKKNIKCR